MIGSVDWELSSVVEEFFSMDSAISSFEWVLVGLRDGVSLWDG